MDVHEDELIELEARAILIRSYVQVLAQAPLDMHYASLMSNIYLQKLQHHVCALEPLAVHVGKLRWMLASSQTAPNFPDQVIVRDARREDLQHGD